MVHSTIINELLKNFSKAFASVRIGLWQTVSEVRIFFLIDFFALYVLQKSFLKSFYYLLLSLQAVIRNWMVLKQMGFLN